MAVLCKGYFVKEGPVYYRVHTSYRNYTATPLAADVLLVIDESGSMEYMHNWLPKMVRKLNEQLLEKGIGRVKPNLFGVVGFGGSSFNFQYHPKAHRYNGSALFTADKFEKVREKLTSNGDQEVGFAAIKYALEDLKDDSSTKLALRSGNGIATNVILITNEGDYGADEFQDLTAETIRNILVAKKAVLNVVVNRTMFASTTNEAAFGIDYKDNAYVLDECDGSVLEKKGYKLGPPIPAEVRVDKTKLHYIDLALRQDIRGAAWDLNFLRQANTTLVDYFTEAFTGLKANEIRRQVNVCKICTCNGVTGRIQCRKADDQEQCCKRAGATVSLPGRLNVEIFWRCLSDLNHVVPNHQMRQGLAARNCLYIFLPLSFCSSSYSISFSKQKINVPVIVHRAVVNETTAEVFLHSFFSFFSLLSEYQLRAVVFVTARFRKPSWMQFLKTLPSW